VGLKNSIVAWEKRCTLERESVRQSSEVSEEGSAAHKTVSTLRLV
jgi:hypothetical protein